MHTAYIGLGSNLPSCAGDPEATLTQAAERLRSLGRIITRSSLYSTRPIGLAAQPRFVNAVIALETALQPRQLLECLLAIESEFGRVRDATVTNGPRTLDLDILLFDNVKVDESNLQIPHPRLAERAFVLIPLNEIGSLIFDANTGNTVGQLLYTLFPNLESDFDEVVPLQNDGWRSGAGWDVSDPGAASCAIRAARNHYCGG